jgi:hypothetical protein
MTLPLNYWRFGSSIILLMVWLSYLAWLVTTSRPEPILQTTGLASWPSRAWLASVDAVIEIKSANSGMEIVSVFKAPTSTWQSGQKLDDALNAAVETALVRMTPSASQASSWIIGLQAFISGEGKPEWKLANDPPVPGRKEGPPRMIPATAWARAWMASGS